MILLAVGCSYRNTPIGLRERLAFDEDKQTLALDELNARYGCEVVILSTCNRVEVYLAQVPATLGPDADLIAEFLAEIHSLSVKEIRPHLFEHQGSAVVDHLFRVASSLDSLIVGEGQIAGQVRQAYEKAQARHCVGPLLNALFQHALFTAKRIRTETGLAQGKVSVASAAIAYVRQVFDYFGDKTVLVIGAGKMGKLTLRHLRELHPQQILVTNRSPEKAVNLAHDCGGLAVPWEQLGDLLAQADIVLSTTGARGADCHSGALREDAVPANQGLPGHPGHRRATRFRPGHPRR